MGSDDHFLRAKMIAKLYQFPTAQRLIPFVMSSCSEFSTYVWTDDECESHDIYQAEGGEQGGALRLVLFCLVMHDALVNAPNQIQPHEKVLLIWMMCVLSHPGKGAGSA